MMHLVWLLNVGHSIITTSLLNSCIKSMWNSRIQQRSTLGCVALLIILRTQHSHFLQQLRLFFDLSTSLCLKQNKLCELQLIRPCYCQYIIHYQSPFTLNIIKSVLFLLKFFLLPFTGYFSSQTGKFNFHLPLQKNPLVLVLSIENQMKSIQTFLLNYCSGTVVWISCVFGCL